MREALSKNSGENSLIEIIGKEDLQLLQHIARDTVFEPFTGHRNLESIQKTRTDLEKRFKKLKQSGVKARKWLTDSRLATRSQDGINRLLQDFKAPASERLSGFFERMNQASEEVQRIAKKSYSGIEEKAKRLTLVFIEKGLDLLLFEFSPEWVLKRTRKILQQPELTDRSQIQSLSTADRRRLIETLYPYDSQTFYRFLKRFDLSVNIGLGAVVATNIPGTGLAVSIVNMGKTIVKTGNRIAIMSAIYGLKIRSKAALFKMSATILRSLEDWESNDNHYPLDPSVLEDLYAETGNEDEDAFQSLLNSVIRKDAYIAIPGVGMISLGKINLDDMKMEQMVLHLVRNYAEKKRLVDQYGSERIEAIIADFQIVYRCFFKAGYFKIMKQNITMQQQAQTSRKWRSRLKWLTGEDSDMAAVSTFLDMKAWEIYQELNRTSKVTEDRVHKAVSRIMDQMMEETI